MLAAVGVALACMSTSCAVAQDVPTRYCALMQDSIGLYVGNPVTQMGFKVGTVDRVTPANSAVKVDFSVTEKRRLPENVQAVIRSTSILADRALELVGNYDAGPELKPDVCIPLTRSATPKSLSEVIGSTATFVKAMSPNESTGIRDAVGGLDRLTHGNGEGINGLLTRSSELLESPDREMADIGAIVPNLAKLTSALNEMRAPLKNVIVDAAVTMPDVSNGVGDAARFATPLWPIIQLVEDLEIRLGETTQLTLDTVSVALRKLSPHAAWIAHLFDPVPWWVNTFANHANNHRFNVLPYRPPMYRIKTPDGLALCGYMNADMPGSCADVAGQPYAADVSLLQYVFLEAAKR
ncbi:Mce family protein [Mycobacteroides abscessus subsp. bolletii]|nr:Mce family protein [Mycobacteroides abscessus subsp. bolletii]SKP62108.1 Mce family protein [Mycobacteroides abscessus subsp. bolletii]SKP73772.1 Mce family protein [Mycobacteroides abscessus subsp. bolletii]SKQ21089.1 Mce family protein [Mycobacteroides abscessus subsp. bolletii]